MDACIRARLLPDIAKALPEQTSTGGAG